MTDGTGRIQVADLPGIEGTHTRLVLADVQANRLPLVVEIFPDRLHPHAGWTKTDLVLGFAASLCCPDGGDTTRGKSRKTGWHARADGEWLPKLDEAKGAFAHPCGQVDNGAFLVVRTPRAPRGAPTLLLNVDTLSSDHAGSVHLHDGQTLPMPLFRGQPYRHTLASPAVDGWARGRVHKDTLGELQRVTAFAMALDGQAMVPLLAHQGGVATLVALAELAHTTHHEGFVQRLRAGLHGQSSTWNTLKKAQHSWIVGPDRPWGATTYRCHTPKALADLVGHDQPRVQALARAARVLWDAFGGHDPVDEPTAHTTLHHLAVLAQARAAMTTT